MPVLGAEGQRPVIVLDFGRKIASGTPREVQNNDEVVRVYLGV